MMDFGDNYMAYLPNRNGGNYGVAYQRQDERGLHPGPSNGRSPLLNSDHTMRNGEYYNEGGGSNLNISDPRYAAKYGNPYLRDPRSQDINGIRRGMISSGADMDGAHLSPVQSPHRAPNAMVGEGRQYATLNTRNGRPYSPNSSGYRNHHGYGTMQQKGTKGVGRERQGGGNPGGSLLPGVLTENAKMVGNTLNSATNAAAAANKYIGTMLGNGSISRPSNENGGYSSISKIPLPLSQKGGKPNHPSINEGSSNGRVSEMKTSNRKGGNFHQEGKVESQYILSPDGDAANQAALATHV